VNRLTHEARDVLRLRHQAHEEMAVPAAAALAREQPRVRVEHVRRRGRTWGLAATVRSEVVSGAMTVQGAIDEVSEWLDLVAEAERLAREHLGARVRVEQDAVGMWVLNARLGDERAEGDVGMVSEWLAFHCHAE
jgi:hypothetical protein